uniref:Pentapeptide repeat-containing protein n=1 Tax=viral metagenome TaxID=1070528 RepID=A0A6M3L530_9ZZZZ
MIELLFENEKKTMKETLEEAVSKKTNLFGANLTGANLTGAYLFGAYLSGLPLSAFGRRRDDG